MKEAKQTRQTWRGCDSRFSLLFITRKMEGKCRSEIWQLLGTLVEICEIAYSSAIKRSSKSVLRLHNLAYFHHKLCTENIKCLKLTRRKFFGIYFHAITREMALVYRLTCLRSINAEQEERQFTDLKSISGLTSSKTPQNIIDNGLVRIQWEKKNKHRRDPDENKISKLGKRFIFSRTSVPYEHLKSENWQAHCEVISDYLNSGDWWERDESTKSIVFFDGPNDPDFRESGPPLMHFRDSKMHDVYRILRENWEECIRDITKLPLDSIKVYDTEGNFVKRINNGEEGEEMITSGKAVDSEVDLAMSDAGVAIDVPHDILEEEDDDHYDTSSNDCQFRVIQMVVENSDLTDIDESSAMCIASTSTDSQMVENSLTATPLIHTPTTPSPTPSASTTSALAVPTPPTPTVKSKLADNCLTPTQPTSACNILQTPKCRSEVYQTNLARKMSQILDKEDKTFLSLFDKLLVSHNKQPNNANDDYMCALTQLQTKVLKKESELKKVISITVIIVLNQTNFYY